VIDRRRFLASSVALLGTSLLGPRSIARALAAGPSDEFFVFVHAAGGWDVSLWADPRNERHGIVEPASTDNTDVAAIKRWVDVPLDGGTRSFRVLEPKGTNLRLGPGIGDLVDLADRLCIVNGLSMNTVSHPDGTAFSITGRHLSGGRSPQSSVEVMIANELGVGQLFPAVSVSFPSSYANEGRAPLDRRAVPLAVDRIGAIGRSLDRTDLYEEVADRDDVAALLRSEAATLAQRSTYPDAVAGMGTQTGAAQNMLRQHVQDLFEDGPLKAAQPAFDYKARFAGRAALDAAFALEAMKRNLVRCVAFSSGGFDTHASNYRTQALVQQELFGLVATLVKQLDATPHPTRTGRKLADHTHIVVLSDFCRTPQINLAGGRDHYPNNSALVISPRFSGGLCFGKTDHDQLLPAIAKRFADGERPIAPPDLLATLLSAFQIEPHRYLRDGEVVPELLRA
jgi:hypothetical protein